MLKHLFKNIQVILELAFIPLLMSATTVLSHDMGKLCLKTPISLYFYVRNTEVKITHILFTNGPMQFLFFFKL